MKFYQSRRQQSSTDRADSMVLLSTLMWSVLLGFLATVAGALAAAPGERPFREIRFREYLIRVHETGGPRMNEKIEILRNGESLFTAEDHRVRAAGLNLGPERPYDPIGVGEDLTGDGQPNLVVELYSGGAHCCDTYLIFEIGDRFLLINRLGTGDYSMRFRDLDDTPGFEIETLDDTFAYWRAPFAGSPAPRVVLAYRDGAYRPAPDLMRRPPMPAPIRNTRARRIREGGGWDRDELYPLDSRLWAVMLDLVYSGNALQAREFLELAWPPNRPGKDLFSDEFFRCKLRHSLYWPVVANMNDLVAARPEAVGDCKGRSE